MLRKREDFLRAAILLEKPRIDSFGYADMKEAE